MNRLDFLKLFTKYRNGAPAIAGPGLGCRELFTIEGDNPSILYNMDMPYVTPFCFGIALATDLPRVVAIEGDGSLLAGLGTLTTVARYKPSNLTIIVLDNSAYATFGHGEMSSATAQNADLAEIARASGISSVRTVRTPSEANEVLPQALGEPGPWVVVAKLEQHGDTDPNFSRVPPDVVENGARFYQYLQNRLRQS